MHNKCIAKVKAKGPTHQQIKNLAYYNEPNAIKRFGQS
jgi:hypothetical protein